MDDEPVGYVGGQAADGVEGYLGGDEVEGSLGGVPGDDEVEGSLGGTGDEVEGYLGGGTGGDEVEGSLGGTDDEVEGYLGGGTGEQTIPEDFGEQEIPEDFAATLPGDEVAGYLGGAPAGDSGHQTIAEDAEVAGYIGGAEGELPALPPQDDATYSHQDFIQQEDEYGDDPYNDPYAAPRGGLPGEQGDDEYGEPHDEHDEYGDSAVAQADPAYFDSMGHGDEDEGYGSYDDYGDKEYDSLATKQIDDNYDDNYDDDSPKTISQQDAETIIRRITTKRILPPETEAPPMPVRPKYTHSGGGLRVWPIVVAVLVLALGGIYLFRQPIAGAFPSLAGLLGVEIKEENVIQEVVQEDPKVVLKRNLLRMIRNSELKAFGAKPEDLSSPADGTAEANQDPGGE